MTGTDLPAALGSTGFHPAFAFLGLALVLAILAGFRWDVRRGFQVGAAGLFVGLLWLAAYGGRPGWPVEVFLLVDPLVAVVQGLAARGLEVAFAASLLVVGVSVVMGRVFCSHVCPLGALLDLSDRGLGRRQGPRENRETYRRARLIKHVLLVGLVFAGLAGVNLLGFADPLVLATRFAALLFYPFALLLQEAGLDALQPVARLLDWVSVQYLEVPQVAFEGALATFGLLAALLLLSRLQPRFWCRHLCPLGAGLGWLGRRAPYRRRVDEERCTACNRCTRDCPTGAIHLQGRAFDRQECIVCRQCARVCPEGAVGFGLTGQAVGQAQPGPSLARRGFLASALGGLAIALPVRADLGHPRPGQRPLRDLVRPPGALPEPEFLARCIRCGECMRACLTHTLQPDWHRAGLEGLWAPVMRLRHAPCEHTCAVCGQVCPTGAIRSLALVEKQHAKVGTAVIRKERCIAWAQDRRCLICDEVCPYNAIYAVQDAAHKVGLPVVEEKRCAGCGTCETRCPVAGEAAILVTPHGELRLAHGSYVAEALVLGYDFQARGGELPDQVFHPRPRVGDVPVRLEPEPPPAGGGARPELPPGIEPEPDEGLPSLPPGIEPEP
jgi:MauM/NapG family ferredoxin protein